MSQDTDKALLNGLFALLRKAGVTARQDFKCCSSCAGYALATELAPLTPVVFYHRQDAQRAFDGQYFRVDKGYGHETPEPGGIYLRFGYTTNAAYPDANESPEAKRALGKFVCECAAKAGLITKWNGDPDDCVWVQAVEDPRPDDEPTPATIAAIAISPA